VSIDATHVNAVGLRHALDSEILTHAIANEFVIVTLDDDFPEMLALGGGGAPSTVHLRGVAHLHPEDHAALLIAAAPEIARELAEGPSIISLTRGRMRIRRLPIR